MTNQFLHPNSVSDNNNLLTKIAQVHLALKEIAREGKKHWAEDDNPITRCICDLGLAAQRIAPETPEDCLAVLTITHEDSSICESSLGCLDKFERKARLTAIDITRNK